MYRLIGANHALGGLPFSAQVFLRSLDGIRSRLAREAGVSGTELRALSRIAEESHITPAALAEHLDLPQTAADVVTNELSGRGLLLTTADPADGPSFELTPTGHSLMEKVYLDFQGSITAAADSLDDERRSVFDSALLKMARKLDAAAGDALPATN
ncbi:MarR family winged helix-turn-helix transcriptional regulator [Glaciihabitans sp. dw_435]|uniref:MarR family winged helix-turn-helix transcriptional regulator n=1 Tax=Glaciihabitans sp. dw_435 TaxID=2720081 RepID=UPI001BD36041|nr:MarR family winged helix-turn-helix transcriptional regulator [Glaciihabitans sp. dw_435]